MFKKHKVSHLLLLFLLSNGLAVNAQFGLKSFGVKKFLLGAGSVLAAGFAISKAVKYQIYLESKNSFDANTENLLTKINSKYAWQFAKLEDYNYQDAATKAEINQDLAYEITDQYDISLYLVEFKALQSELEARFARLTSRFGTEYLYQKWYDNLSEASMNMYNLQLWLEQVEIMPR